MRTPGYLSKRESGTYCIIINGLPVNQYTTKQACIDLAKTKNIELCMRIWSAAVCAWIYE